MVYNLPQRGATALAVAASLLAFSGAPAFANTSPLGGSFNSVEYTMSGDDVLPAEQALVSRIVPQGSLVQAARVSLAKAGARYAGIDPQGDQRFVYTTTDMVNCILHDVAVTVVLHQEEGVVRSVDVNRVSFGS